MKRERIIKKSIIFAPVLVLHPLSNKYKMTKQRKRLISFDLLKVFAIFLVLWGHCIQYFLSTHYSADPIYRIIYSFHMPLFMMISAFFSANSYNLTFKVLFEKKFTELLLPIFVWGTFFLIGCTILNVINGEIIFLFYDIKAILTKNLWFLKSLFVCYILAYFCFNKGRTNYIFLFSTLLSSQFVISHNICTMYPSFLIGVYLQKHKNLISSKILLFSTLILFIFMLILWDASFWPVPNMLEAITQHNMTPIYEYLYKGIYRIIIGATGSLFFIALFNILFCNKIKNTNFADMGKYTLGVYIIQSIVLESIAGKYIKFDNMNFYMFHFVITPIISFTLFLFFTFIVRLTYKYPKLSLLLWGKRR